MQFSSNLLLEFQNWKLKISEESSFAFLPVSIQFRPEKIGRLRLGCLDSRTVGPNNRLPWGKGPIRSNSDEIAVIGWNNMWLSPAILGYESSDNIRKNHTVLQTSTHTRYKYVYIQITLNYKNVMRVKFRQLCHIPGSAKLRNWLRDRYGDISQNSRLCPKLSNFSQNVFFILFGTCR